MFSTHVAEVAGQTSSDASAVHVIVTGAPLGDAPVLHCSDASLLW